LLNDRYLNDYYGKKPLDKGNLMRCYWALFRRLWTVRQYDMLLLEKEIFPFLPAFAEWWLNRLKVPYIVDYDDAIFHNYDQHPNKLVRFLFRRKIARVMRRSGSVVCGNPYLADYAKRSGASRIAHVPTVIDTGRYKLAGDKEANRPVVIGWIGTPATIKYLHLIKPVLVELVWRYNVEVHIIGSGQGLGLGEQEKLLPWTEDKEPALIGVFDIGVMPLEDSPWERGKCGYKLIQYMGCGIPVVGSPVGVNQEIINDGVNGFIAESLEDWKRRLERLVRDVQLRKTLGQNGRRIVEDKYSLKSGAASWISELNHLQSLKRH
jgi:glycosyltransferase involved in cell wall biosynthesis